MPIARIARTRRSLPEGYQFGDAGRTTKPDIRIGFNDGGMIGFLDHAITVLSQHRADTTDPDGYGHAV